MVYQDVNFKICLSLFGWKELKLHNVHIVQWSNLPANKREGKGVHLQNREKSRR